MARIIAGLVLLALGAGVVEAQGAADIIKQRQDHMGALGDALKTPSAIMKGAPFDLATVQASLKTIEETASKLKPLWPETSKAGGDTRALPVVWTDLKAFVARFETMATQAKAASGAIKDEASFKSEWPKVVGNCGGCHKNYRAEKK
jgi:cytochrome c556